MPDYLLDPMGQYAADSDVGAGDKTQDSRDLFQDKPTAAHPDCLNDIVRETSALEPPDVPPRNSALVAPFATNDREEIEWAIGHWQREQEIESAIRTVQMEPEADLKEVPGYEQLQRIMDSEAAYRETSKEITPLDYLAAWAEGRSKP